jgi:transcriptional regulator with XRE-family HTH domain
MSRHEEVSVNATLRLREDQLAKFRRMTRLDTEAKLAAAMGAHQGTVNRVLNGKQNPSQEFIASLVSAFDGASFEDLWEIRVIEGEAA